MKSILLFCFFALFVFTNCKKITDNNTTNGTQFFYAFKDRNPYEGEIEIYQEDSTFIKSIICDPNESIYIKGDIEFAYEIKLSEGNYLFYIKEEKLYINQAVKGDIVLEW